MSSSFPCSECGLCCKKISLIPELRQYDRGDGTCKYLIESRCSIYDTRPQVCRIDDMYHNVYYKTYSKEQFYEENLKVCKALQIEANIPPSDKVKT
ncbi:YkgJ family cysteine cluster protein [Bacillus sp. HMF5848]|uniref:YkgJ family cysteine cluster protein n=1 Tax=Bacillus sp. HMF5848 TaxID=2495421 RepID=UPI000F7A179E|nr:YkgJ family cysteine cluster protein [Bacillus sp. HMF5848]